MFLKRYGVESRNIPLLYASGVIGGVLFFLPILALYYKENLFSVTNVALIFSIEAIAVTILEVPTGAVADLFGRKKTIILAHLIAVIALLFLYFGSTMLMFGLYAIFNALARSLNSGSDSAIIYDTLKAECKERHYKKIIGVSHALWPFGAVIGSVAGGYLATVSLSFPILLTFIPLILAFILTLFLKEPDYEKEDHKNVFRHMFRSAFEIMKNRQILLLFISGFLLFAFGESTHLLKPLFFEFKQIPIIYFGYIFGVTFGLSSLGHYLSHDISEKIGNKMTLILSAIAFPLFLLLATFAFGLWAAVLIVITSIPFGLRNPVTNHMLNIEVSSRNRATVLSINNLVQYLGVVLFAPAIGYLADLFTINTAFRISALLMFVAVVLLLFIEEKN